MTQERVATLVDRSNTVEFIRTLIMLALAVAAAWLITHSGAPGVDAVVAIAVGVLVCQVLPSCSWLRLHHLPVQAAPCGRWHP